MAAVEAPVTTALMRARLDVDTPVDCPPTISVQGKSFQNFEREAAGQVPAYVDFAQSCNTAFASLAGRLDDGTMTSTAREFGRVDDQRERSVPVLSDLEPDRDAALVGAILLTG